MVGLIPFNKKNQSFLDSSISELQNMLDDFFTENWLPSRSLKRDTFKIDVEESGNEYLVHAELPGIQKDEINLSIDDGKLTISVNKEENIDEQNKTYIHKERRYTSMSRSVYLADTKADSIKAKLENGVLVVRVPKQEKPNNAVSIDIE